MVEPYGYENTPKDNGIDIAEAEQLEEDFGAAITLEEDEDAAAAQSGCSPPIGIRDCGRAGSHNHGLHDVDELDESVLQEMLLKASPKFTEPFNINQITRNVSIGRAARREMDVASSFGGAMAESYAAASAAAMAASENGYYSQSTRSSGGGGGAGAAASYAGGGASTRAAGSGASSLSSSLLPNVLPSGLPNSFLSGAMLPSSALLASVSSIGTFDAEIARQRATVAAMEDDVEEESRVNRELAGRIIERLENSCKVLEGLSSLLSALGAAEAAYSSAMAAAARVRLVGLDADDGEVRAAGEALQRLPQLIHEAHSPLTPTLSGLSKELGALLARYRASVREVSSEAATARRNIDAARQHLGVALGEHVSACRAFEGVLAERQQRRAPTRGPDSDPWATEGRLVQEQQALQYWQDKERLALKNGFQRVTELEQTRLELSTQAMSAALESYRRALLPLQAELQAASSLLRAIEPEAKLGVLRDMAATASRTAEGLAARQAECLHSVCHELFCSPEIVRQGDLQILEPASQRWRKCHFVLTRAGYLHWFTRADDVRPQGGLALARCAIEDGMAPRFNVMETPKGAGWFNNIRGRRVTFQAASVEECCDWVIEIRQAIAVASGKQLAFEEEGGTS